MMERVNFGAEVDYDQMKLGVETLNLDEDDGGNPYARRVSGICHDLDEVLSGVGGAVWWWNECQGTCAKDLRDRRARSKSTPNSEERFCCDRQVAFFSDETTRCCQFQARFSSCNANENTSSHSSHGVASYRVKEEDSCY